MQASLTAPNIIPENLWLFLSKQFDPEQVINSFPNRSYQIILMIDKSHIMGLKYTCQQLCLTKRLISTNAH